MKTIGIISDRNQSGNIKNIISTHDFKNRDDARFIFLSGLGDFAAYAGCDETLTLEADGEVSVESDNTDTITMSSQRFWGMSLFVNEFLSVEGPYKGYFERVFKRLQEIGLSNAYFFLDRQSLIYEVGESDDNKKRQMYYAGGFDENSWEFFPSTDWHHYQLSARKGFNEYLPAEKKGDFYAYLLAAGDKEYGVVLCNAKVEDDDFLRYASIQMSNLFYLYRLKIKEEAIVKEIQLSLDRVRESNQILSFISRYDELTQILNRRGFMEQTLATIRRIQGREALIMFSDLDHLKEINDCFGHGDGDFAISSAAKLLTGLMPREGFVARMGGDEFVAFIPVPAEKSAEEYIGTLKDELKEAMFLFNLTCNKPYFVEMSSGFYSFVCAEDMDIAKIIASSDEVLYEAKKERRESIKKG